LKKLKESPFRQIVVSMRRELEITIEAIDQAMKEYGPNNIDVIKKQVYQQSLDMLDKYIDKYLP